MGGIEIEVAADLHAAEDILVERIEVAGGAYQALELGGDVGGGSYALDQVIFRPVPSLAPYRTPLRGLYIGSAATFSSTRPRPGAGSAPVITSLTTPTAAARITKCSIKQTNSLDTGRFFVAGTGGTGGSSIAGVKSEQLENEYRTISGTMTAEFFTPATYYDVFAGDTNLSLELVFTGPQAIISTYFPTLSILIPVIKFDEGSPAVPGPGLVMEDLTFAGLDGETYNQIQIQYMTSDIAF